ncbi:MAG: serine hydrolase [Chitinophagaceae bacterium]|nr:serine hydrolase [Chitinophagaceae bacterium]
MPCTMPRRITVLFILLSFACCAVVGQPAAKPVAAIVSVKTVAFKDTMPTVADSSHTDAFLADLLKQYPQYFSSILEHRNAYNVQVIYTKVDRGANGIAALKNYYFNVNSNRYCYPAGAVALPVAMLSMQRLNELKATGIDKNTCMLTGKVFSGQTAVYNDPTTPDGKPSLANYFRKMLIAGDATAFNRLYEFLGQGYINGQLQQKGYPTAQVIQRLETELTEEEQRHTNPIQFLATGNKPVYQQPMQYNGNPYLQRKDSLGKAYYEGDELIQHPMDFSGQNKITLEDLHTLLISLVFPNKVTASQRFAISDGDRKYLLKYMSQLPGETFTPPYQEDTTAYYPAYRKYLLYGAVRGTIPSDVRIVNTTGEAYGQLTDVAYIVDFDKKIEFFLSAVIFCSSDGTLAEDHYDYESTGLPFMQHLGQVIYEYETKREKKIIPDLSEVKFEYDGR